MRGTDPFPVIRVYDPAIDTTLSPMSDYVAERDITKLVFVEGERPTIFHCRPLTLQERRDVRNKPSDGDRYEAAFVRGLVKVERLVHPDGSVRDWLKPDARDGKSRPLADSSLEQYFDEADVQEIGSVIWHRSFLPRGSKVFYPLLDTSRLALTAMLFHRAGPTSASAESLSRDKPQAEEPLHVTPPSSPAGDAPIAATATG